MAFSVKAIKGTNDVLPSESHKYQYVEQAALDTAKSFGFLEMRWPHAPSHSLRRPSAVHHSSPSRP